MKINDDYAERYEDLVRRYSRTAEAVKADNPAPAKPAKNKRTPFAEVIDGVSGNDAVIADLAHKYSRLAEVMGKKDAAFSGTEEIYARAKSTEGRDTLLADTAQKFAFASQGSYDAVLAGASQRMAEAMDISRPDEVIMTAVDELYSLTMNVYDRRDAVLASGNHYLG